MKSKSLNRKFWGSFEADWQVRKNYQWLNLFPRGRENITFEKWAKNIKQCRWEGSKQTCYLWGSMHICNWIFRLFGEVWNCRKLVSMSFVHNYFRRFLFVPLADLSNWSVLGTNGRTHVIKLPSCFKKCTVLSRNKSKKKKLRPTILSSFLEAEISLVETSIL